MRALFATLFASFLALALHAAPPELQGLAREAYVTLKDATTFCSGRIGVAGAVPNQVVAFRNLKDDPMGDAAFKSLLAEAKPVGQLYALCGLWYTDPAAFKAGAYKLRLSDTKVDTMEGCVGFKKRMGDIVESKDPGAVRLKSNKESVKDWLDTHKGISMHYDIIGGAYSSMIWSEGGFKLPMKPDGGAGSLR